MAGGAANSQEAVLQPAALQVGLELLVYIGGQRAPVRFEFSAERRVVTIDELIKKRCLRAVPFVARRIGAELAWTAAMAADSLSAGSCGQLPLCTQRPERHAVSALHTTNGRWDIVAELRADSLEAFDRVLARIRLVEGISSTETSLLLSSYKL